MGWSRNLRTTYGPGKVGVDMTWKLSELGCTIFGPLVQTFLVDVEPVPSGEVRHYMNRSTHPNLGSWGQDSAGVERTVPCD